MDLNETHPRGIETFREHLRKLRELRTAELIDEARRIGPAARKRRRLLQSATEKLGIDLSSLDKAHDKDWQTILKQTAKQQKAAIAFAKTQRARERQILRHVTKHRQRFEHKSGNPHTSICLWQATRRVPLTFTPQTFNDGTATLLTNPLGPQPSVGQNIKRFSAEVIANAAHDFHLSPVAAADIFTSHTFETTVQQRGVISVVANYVPSGTIFLGAPGDCVFPGSAGAEVVLFMQVEVETADGDTIEFPVGATRTIVDQEVRASCDGESRLVQVGTKNGVAHQLTHRDIVDVEPGDLVRVIAGFDIFIAAALSGAARATFDPRPSGLNVPMVLVKIDS